jgi:hypothetical protein
MGMVRFAELVPDMVLDADVITDQGRLLLPTGTALTAQHLRVMRKWGIEQADIRGVTPDDVTEDVMSRLEPAAVESITAAVAALFRRSNLEHPAVCELVELTRRRLVDHYLASLPSADGTAPETSNGQHGA